MAEKSELAQLVPEAKYIEDVAAFVQGALPPCQPLKSLFQHLPISFAPYI
jgi:hypothetical protein